MTRQAIWQNKRKQAGLCTICGKGAIVRSLRCEQCAARHGTIMKKQRNKNKLLDRAKKPR